MKKNKNYRIIEMIDNDGYVVDDNLNWQQAFISLMSYYSYMCGENKRGNYRAKELSCYIESYEYDENDEEVNIEIKMMKVIK